MLGGLRAKRREEGLRGDRGRRGAPGRYPLGFFQAVRPLMVVPGATARLRRRHAASTLAGSHGDKTGRGRLHTHAAWLLPGRTREVSVADDEPEIVHPCSSKRGRTGVPETLELIWFWRGSRAARAPRRVKAWRRHRPRRQYDAAGADFRHVRGAGPLRTGGVNRHSLLRGDGDGAVAVEDDLGHVRPLVGGVAALCGGAGVAGRVRSGVAFPPLDDLSVLPVVRQRRSPGRSARARGGAPAR